MLFTDTVTGSTQPTFQNFRNSYLGIINKIDEIYNRTNDVNQIDLESGDNLIFTPSVRVTAGVKVTNGYIAWDVYNGLKMVFRFFTFLTDHYVNSIGNPTYTSLSCDIVIGIGDVINGIPETVFASSNYLLYDSNGNGGQAYNGERINTFSNVESGFTVLLGVGHGFLNTTSGGNSPGDAKTIESILSFEIPTDVDGQLIPDSVVLTWINSGTLNNIAGGIMSTFGNRRAATSNEALMSSISLKKDDNIWSIDDGSDRKLGVLYNNNQYYDSDFTVYCQRILTPECRGVVYSRRNILAVPTEMMPNGISSFSTDLSDEIGIAKFLNIRLAERPCIRISSVLTRHGVGFRYVE